MKSKANPHEEPKQDIPKKPYGKPHVQVYGDLRVLTQNVGGTGNGDGSGQAMLKTQT